MWCGCSVSRGLVFEARGSQPNLGLPPSLSLSLRKRSRITLIESSLSYHHCCTFVFIACCALEMSASPFNISIARLDWQCTLPRWESAQARPSTAFDIAIAAPLDTTLLPRYATWLTWVCSCAAPPVLSFLDRTLMEAGCWLSAMVRKPSDEARSPLLCCRAN